MEFEETEKKTGNGVISEDKKEEPAINHIGLLIKENGVAHQDQEKKKVPTLPEAPAEVAAPVLLPDKEDREETANDKVETINEEKERQDKPKEDKEEKEKEKEKEIEKEKEKDRERSSSLTEGKTPRSMSSSPATSPRSLPSHRTPRGARSSPRPAGNVSLYIL